jgi:hypothetical protein
MSALSPELQALVQQLIEPTRRGRAESHARGLGGDPSMPRDKPVHMLNLLRCKPLVRTPEGSITLAASGKYSAGVGSAFARVGGTLLCFAKVAVGGDLNAGPCT